MFQLNALEMMTKLLAKTILKMHLLFFFLSILTHTHIDTYISFLVSSMYSMIKGNMCFCDYFISHQNARYAFYSKPAASHHLKECGQKSNAKTATLVLSVPSRSYLRTSLPDTNKFLLLSATKP